MPSFYIKIIKINLKQMENQNNNLNTEPTETVMEIKPRRIWWKFALGVLAVAILAGGGYWVWKYFGSPSGAQTISDMLFLHPIIAGFSIDVISLVAALFLSLWSGRKLFKELAVKNRRWASIAAFIWYVILSAYFSFLLPVLSVAILLDFGIQQDEINRMYFAVGNYPLIFFFVFLVGGAAALFSLIKKQPQSPAPAAVSLTRALWNGTKKSFFAILVAFLALVLARVPAVQEKQVTQEVVAKIHAQKLTLADVMGERLPPEPDPALKDATVEGIDANGNGIRDDVEFAIFKLYPDSAKIRAAELQYAMELQFQFTDVFNTDTFIAAIQEDGRGFGCIFETEPGRYPDLSKELADQNKKINGRLDEVKNLILNTNERRSMYENNFKKYMTSYPLLSGQDCDIDSGSLSN